MPIYDFFGNRILPGDIIVRAKGSKLIFHRVIENKGKSLLVSVQKLTHRIGDNEKITFIADVYDVADIEKQKDSILIRTGLGNMIKYHKEKDEETKIVKPVQGWRI